MKLKFSIEDCSDLLRVVGFALAVKKAGGSGQITQLTMCFDPKRIVVTSSNLGGALIWCQIDSSSLSDGEYVISAKCDLIGMQISSQALYNVLIAYHQSTLNSNPDSLKVRLQYAPNVTNSRRQFVLGFSFQEGTIAHHFEIPIALLRPAQAEALSVPPPNNIQLTMAMDTDFLNLLRRIERYRGFDSLEVKITQDSQLILSMHNEKKLVSLKWRKYLAIKDYDGAEHSQLTIVKVNPKWWNISIKMLEISSTIQMIIHQNGCIFSTHINDNPDYLILYYVPGILIPN